MNMLLADNMHQLIIMLNYLSTITFNKYNLINVLSSKYLYPYG